MDKLQIVFFFISGFLVSRLIIKAGLPERIVSYVLGRRRVSITAVSFYLIAVSAFLSFFIPNAITVLTMLPVLELLRQTFEKNSANHRRIPTVLALSVIYGSNIGGMGTITGTPANGILITYLEAERVVGAGAIQYATWLVWGAPMAACMVILAWLVITILLRPHRYVNESIRVQFELKESGSVQRRWAVALTAVYILSSLILSVLMLKEPEHVHLILVITGLFTALFVLFLFFALVDDGSDPLQKRPLLTIRDCYSNLPMRGFFFVGVAVALAIILYFLGAQHWLSQWIAGLLPTHVQFYLFLLVAALVTSFATEALSNTAVQISMFMILLPLCREIGFSPVKTLLLVTLSCTCAFMSPIATGVNGLAYGGVRNVSILRMLIVGGVMNVLAGVFISWWVYALVPW
jgi:solute carrier family 13 (sodium-dependent dicarboxylate transporter), member 2/3/5